MRCPKCDYFFDTQSTLDEQNENQIPKVGDPTICLNCTEILVFDNSMIPRIATEDQLNQFRSIPEFWNEIQKIRYYIKEVVNKDLRKKQNKMVKTIAGDFDEARYKRLRIDYNNAVDRGDNMFEFDGEKMLTQFGKYLLDFLSTQFHEENDKKDHSH